MTISDKLINFIVNPDNYEKFFDLVRDGKTEFNAEDVKFSFEIKELLGVKSFFFESGQRVAKKVAAEGRKNLKALTIAYHTHSSVPRKEGELAVYRGQLYSEEIGQPGNGAFKSIDDLMRLTWKLSETGALRSVQ